MINVFVEEEYGWKNWRWEAPFDSPEELIDWWRSLNPEVFIKSVWSPQRSESQPPMADLMGGKWNVDEGEHDWEEIISLHVHEEEDTALCYAGVTYPIGRPPQQLIDHGMHGSEEDDISEWYEGAGGYPRIFNPDANYLNDDGEYEDE